MSLDDLRRDNLVDTVTADTDGAWAVLDTCERHLASAHAISSADPAGAFQLAYDAARKAIGAHMLANGVRTRQHARLGGHVIVGRYAEAVLHDAAPDAVQAFDRMRRRRNRTEYGIAQIEAAEIEDAIDRATQLVAAVRRALG